MKKIALICVLAVMIGTLPVFAQNTIDLPQIEESALENNSVSAEGNSSETMQENQKNSQNRYKKCLNEGEGAGDNSRLKTQTTTQDGGCNQLSDKTGTQKRQQLKDKSCTCQ